MNRLGEKITRGILEQLESEEENYKRQVKKFHKVMIDIKTRKQTLAVKENQNQQQRDNYEENKENWEAELKKKDAQRKEAKEKSKKVEDLLRSHTGK